jgi:hypothetical protein
MRILSTGTNPDKNVSVRTLLESFFAQILINVLNFVHILRSLIILYSRVYFSPNWIIVLSLYKQPLCWSNVFPFISAILGECKMFDQGMTNYDGVHNIFIHAWPWQCQKYEVYEINIHHRVQTGSGAYPASYPSGTRVSFPGGKAAGAWSRPLTSI